MEKLSALDRFSKSDLFDPAERAALAFAEQMTRDASRVDDALFDALRSHYNEGEIVEIASVVGLFNYFNRWNDALGTEVSDPATEEFVDALLPGSRAAQRPESE